MKERSRIQPDRVAEGGAGQTVSRCRGDRERCGSKGQERKSRQDIETKRPQRHRARVAVSHPKGGEHTGNQSESMFRTVELSLIL